MPNAADNEEIADNLMAGLQLIKHNLEKRYAGTDDTNVRALIIATLYDVGQTLSLAKEKNA